MVRGLADLARGYKVVLCDVWGVVHNGLVAFERAAEALARFRAGAGTVVLMKNSPNPGRFVAAQIARL
ncbi:MAG: TIGR01459 family HAD-type hydrolase, partial [Methylocella sp.]